MSLGPRETQLRALREARAAPAEAPDSILAVVSAAVAARKAAELRERDAILKACEVRTIREVAAAAGVSHPTVVALLKKARSGS